MPDPAGPRGGPARPDSPGAAGPESRPAAPGETSPDFRSRSNLRATPGCLPGRPGRGIRWRRRREPRPTSPEGARPMSQPSRRSFLRRALAGSTLPWLAGAGAGADDGPGPGLIVRSTRPLDAETPVEVVRPVPHAQPPVLRPEPLRAARGRALAPGGWRSTGWSTARSSSGLDDLEGLPSGRPCRRSSSARATAGPTSRRRSPASAGTGGRWATPSGRASGWSTSWPGPGSSADAAHVQLLGADGPPNPKTPAFFRSIPLARALDPSHPPGHGHERRAPAAPPRRADPPGRPRLGGQPLDQVAPQDHRGPRGGPRLLHADRLQDPEGPRPRRASTSSRPTSSP